MSDPDQKRQRKKQPDRAMKDGVEDVSRGYAVGDQQAEDRIVALGVQIMERRLERGDAMTDPAVAGHFCAGKLRNFEREVFGVLFLDNRHRLLGFELLFFGTIDGAEVYPREVARAALRMNAAAIIVCHNHPSGSSEPSAADRAVTLRLRDALAMLEIRLLDHFVIGDGPPTSLAARGWV
jgi:DNA repair protein RadC